MIRAALITASLLAAAPVWAANYYGAIAYSASDGVSADTWNYTRKGEAKAQALKDCREQGGKDCKIGVWVMNSCGAFAVAAKEPSMKRSGASWGYTQHAPARKRALDECRKASGGGACKIVKSVCNFGK